MMEHARSRLPVLAGLAREVVPRQLPLAAFRWLLLAGVFVGGFHAFERLAVGLFARAGFDPAGPRP